jgi:hypothetical protein
VIVDSQWLGLCGRRGKANRWPCWWRLCGAEQRAPACDGSGFARGGATARNAQAAREGPGLARGKGTLATAIEEPSSRSTKWPTSEGRCHFGRCVSEDDRREIAVRAAHGAVPQENRGQPAVSKGQPWFSFASFVSTLTNSARSKTKGLLCVFGSSSQRGRTALPDSGGTFLRKAVSDFQSMNEICYRYTRARPGRIEHGYVLYVLACHWMDSARA